MGSFFYLGTAIVSLTNGIVMLIVNPSRMINRVFFFASIWIALWFFCVFFAIRQGSLYSGGPAEDVLLWLRLGSAVAAFTGWFVWLMRSVLLEARSPASRVFKQSVPWFCVSCLIALLAFSEQYIPSDSTPLSSKRGSVYFIYTAAIAACCIILLVDALRQMRGLAGARKVEMQFFVFNTICACLLMVSANLVGTLLDVVWLRRIGPFGFIALHGLTVWAICSHKFFDAKQVMSSIAQRVVFLGALAGAAVIFASILDDWVDHPIDILLAALLTGLLAIAFERPTRKWFGLDPDHLLIRPRRAIIDCARNKTDADELRSSFQRILREWCQTAHADLLLKRPDGFSGTQLSLSIKWLGMSQLCKNSWLTPELMQRKRPDSSTESCARWMLDNQCGALLTVPRGSDQPNMLVYLGHRESLRPYTYPDIQQVFSLAELMDNILTHASLSQHAAKLAQMESAAMMSRSLAHDLNNLTTPVAAFLVHSEGRAKPGSAEAEVYDAALHSVKVMNDYIRESLFFSRRLVPEFKELDPCHAITSVMRLAQGRAVTRNILLKSHCEEGLRFRVDPVLFQRLVLNLVNNAIDASPGNTSVMVFVDGQQADRVRLRVEDEGVGIQAENLKRIFDPYFTTKNTGDTGRGLGLGLAICRKIVDLHGGELDVSSIPGKGSVFTAVFPRLAKASYLPKNDAAYSRDSNPAEQPSAAIGFA